ncbi:MAG: CoA transferase [Acidimicrobiales bacterium]
MSDTMATPLAGTKVVDLTRFVAGSYATMLLAALGAEVLKIEVPPGGDSYRGQGAVKTETGSTLFESLNRAKRSVVLDFREPDGSQALEALLAGGDFLVHNARPGSLARHGLDFAAVHERHPHLVYAAISAFGDVGPDATRGGFDLIVQAASGLMAVTGSPESGPVKVGAPVLDVGAGLAVVIAILAAHSQRASTGIGGEVSSSLLEFALAGLTTLTPDVVATGVAPPLLGTHSPTFAPYGAFAAGDGYLVLAGAGSDRLWPLLCEVLERADLVDDPRFVDNATRVAHRDELTAEIEAVLARRDVADWLVQLDAAGVPAGTVRSLPDLLASEQVAALGQLRAPDGSAQGPHVEVPFRLGGNRPHLGPAPALGADTRAVLTDAGVDTAVVDRICAAGGLR